MTQKDYADDRCPVCRSSDVMSVEVKVSSDTPLSFGFCSQCEWRGWNRSGRSMALASVLGLAGAR